MLLKILQMASDPGESVAGFTYLYMRIHPKRCRIFSLKVAATLLSVSGKSAVGANISSPDVY